MNKATVFSNASSKVPVYKEIDDILYGIRDGKDKQIVLRVRDGKADKKSLSWICFSGEFNLRSNDSLIKHSGIMCIDFDNVRDIPFWKNKLKSAKYCYSVFVSPSGKGLKMLIRVPECKSNDEHNARFDTIANQINCEYLDKNGKGVSRVCFSSYDPEIYINKDAEVFDSILVKPTVSQYATGTILIETSKTFYNLIIWFEKNYRLDKGSRNANLLILASSCRDYNISQDETYKLVYDYAAKKSADFDSIEKEITTIVKQAYKKPSANKTMVFPSTSSVANPEDDFITEIEEDEDIDNEPEEPYLDEIIQYEEEARKDSTNSNFKIENSFIPDEITVFWVESVSGKISLLFLELKEFLEKSGFFRCAEENVKFIRVYNHVIKEATDVNIKNYVINCLIRWDRKDVAEMIKNQRRLSMTDLDMLDIYELQLKQDTEYESFFFFDNTMVSVSRKGLKLVPYSELDGDIWYNGIKKRNFTMLEYKESLKSDFYQFLLNVTGDKPEAVMTAIGYLLSRYKDKSNPKAVILNDLVTEEDTPSGGTGKGIIFQAIDWLRDTVKIVGIGFDSSKDFAWSALNMSTDVVLIDDPDRKFRLDSIFSALTEGIMVNKKNIHAFFIGPEYSPKFVITTNHGIPGLSDSTERRKIDIRLHKFYSVKRKPIDDFKKPLFTSSWSEREANFADNFLLYCNMMFIQKGLVEPIYPDENMRKLREATNQAFVEFAKRELTDNIRFSITAIHKYYREEHGIPEGGFPSHDLFAKWIRDYANTMKFTYTNGTGKGGKYKDLGNGTGNIWAPSDENITNVFKD